ncbi:MAG: N-acetylmannosamine-6-phosphate 2-epimerase [Gammaproteobacteria bacterium]|nr:N-acetylmannosamine-6-phosphate 2-epimerase [Gammaproteobacteria bacterium]
MKPFTTLIPRGLIVSCQARRGDALYGSLLMARMAAAAEQGGAVAIRADGHDDIGAIRAATTLPIIGITKNYYPGSAVYITPTFADAAEAVTAGAVAVALDATPRPRPHGEELQALIDRVHVELDVPVMADISSFHEGARAEQLGADAVATTLAGYVGECPPTKDPDMGLVDGLSQALRIPVIAEGRYQSPAEAVAALQLGAYAVVVGSAITRPHAITERFVSAIKKISG